MEVFSVSYFKTKQAEILVQAGISLQSLQDLLSFFFLLSAISQQIRLM